MSMNIITSVSHIPRCLSEGAKCIVVWTRTKLEHKRFQNDWANHYQRGRFHLMKQCLITSIIDSTLAQFLKETMINVLCLKVIIMIKLLMKLICMIYVSMELIPPQCRLWSLYRPIPFWWWIRRRWLSGTFEPHAHLMIRCWLSMISPSLSRARSHWQ